MEYRTKTARETQKLGQTIGAHLSPGEIIALEGDLGAGKTTFIQGLAEGLGVSARIISPTFIIMRKYETNRDMNFYHLDLYRLEKNIPQELENIGLTDIWGKHDAIVAIEWAEKAKELLPAGTKWITIREEGGERIFNIN